MHPWHPLKAALLIVSAVSVAACASVTVQSYTAGRTDVRQYHTYSWGPSEAISTGDPRLDGNRLFAERVRSRVDAALARRGYEKIENGPPSLEVHFHASVTQKIDLSTVDAPYSGVPRVVTDSYVYDAGTLVIDLVDARSSTLVWRGWAEGSLEGVIDNQAAMEAHIDRAVAQVLQRLPPRL